MTARADGSRPDPTQLANAVVGDLPPRTEREDPPARRSIHLTSADGIKPQRVRWLVDRRIPLAALSLLAGREGLGKSTVAVDIAARVTRGTCDGELDAPRGVIYIASEDSLEHTVVPRLIAAGADLTRVYFPQVLDAEGLPDRLVLPIDGQLLVDAIISTDSALVVLDAATSVLDASLDGDRDRQMRRGLEPMARIGERTGAAILGIVHFGKSASGDTGRLILGSIAWSQVARSVLAVAQADSGGLVMSVTKQNLAGRVPSLAARIISADVQTGDGDTASVGRVVWSGETTTDARDLLAPQEDPVAKDAAAEAAGWLVDWLTLQGGEATRQDVERAGRAAGHSLAAVQRGRTEAGVQYRAEGFPRRTIWFLDPDSLTEATSRQAAQSSHQSSQAGSDNSAGQEQLFQSFQSSQGGEHPALTGEQSAHHGARVDTTGTTGTTGPDQQELQSHHETTGATTGDDCHCGRPSAMHPNGVMGPCARCQTSHHRYGQGGRPLCANCQPASR